MLTPFRVPVTLARMSLSLEIVKTLADGKFHSGQQLGEQLGVSRAAICKAVHQCAALGLDVHAVSGKGYCLRQPMELLEHERIQQSLARQTQALIRQLDVLPSVDSTNQYLLSSARSLSSQAEVCVAEHQTQGRGRRGRSWQSPYGVNIYLSVRWRYNSGPASLSGLSLALGVVLVQALEQHGAQGLSLKWPNDVLLQQHKVAGVLLDVVGEADGPCTLVAGVGINLGLQTPQASEIEQPWANVSFSRTVSRNALVGSILDGMLPCLQQFTETGLAPYLSTWQQYDAYRDQAVTLINADRQTCGIARGISENGALRIEIDGVERNIMAGEVSLRAGGAEC